MPLEPDLTEVLDEVLESWALDLHTAIPGKIKSYDAAKQTAEVIVQVRTQTPKEDGSLQAEEAPVLPNVPVQWPRGGGYALHFPLAPGDFVLLVFSEAAIGHWRETGQLSDPGDLRRHSISYPVAIPGIAPNAGKLTDAPTGEAVLTVGAGVFRVGGASAEMVALANLVQQALDALQQAFDEHEHTVATTGTAAAQSGTAAPVTSPVGQLGPVAATKLRAE